MAKLNRENVPFTQIANAVLNDPRLSWGAKGIFAYMFSKPDNWDFAAERMAKDSKKEKTSGGAKDIRARLKELQQCGYLSAKRLPTGKIKYFLKFSVDPQVPTGNEASEPHALSVKEPLGQRASGDTLNNKELTNNKEIINNIDKKPSVFDWLETSEKMMEKEGSDLDIIATYLNEKKIVPATSQELTGYIKRYRKVAKDIVPFVENNFKRFWNAIEICKEEGYRMGYDWSLETIYKKVTKMK